MMHSSARMAAIFAFGIVIATAGVSRACVDDAECDNGDTCSVADTCTLGSCELGGGGDTNNDLVCDDERDDDIALNLTRFMVRRKTSTRTDNSATKGGGDLFALGSSTFDTLSGFSIRVKDNLSGVGDPGDGVDATVSWLPSECVLKDEGKVACRTADARNALKLRPNALVPGQYKIDYKLKSIGNLSGPFFGPVRVVITHGGNKRIPDTITDCKLFLAGLRCREF